MFTAQLNLRPLRRAACRAGLFFRSSLESQMVEAGLQGAGTNSTGCNVPTEVLMYVSMGALVVSEVLPLLPVPQNGIVQTILMVATTLARKLGQTPPPAGYASMS